ncbi:MAG: alpha/beta fold hydrolase [Bdellovibrionales bacterium]|nr:alpha/beta fold hydrolase [Bdellovibrionales bacterium]
MSQAPPIDAFDVSDGSIWLPATKEPARGSVLLFHGLTGHPSDLRDLAHAIHDTGFHVFVPRLSGHGRGLDVLKRTTAADWLRDAERFFSALKKVTGQTPSLVGMSFGGLLALHCAAVEQGRLPGLVVLSVPYVFRSLTREITMGVLARCPDAVLDRLWLVRKRSGTVIGASGGPPAVTKHAVGAVARLVQIRIRVRRAANKITCPTLILQGSDDHHLRVDAGIKLLRDLGSEAALVELYPHGIHKLTLGEHREQVTGRIVDFLRAGRTASVSSEE